MRHINKRDKSEIIRGVYPECDNEILRGVYPKHDNEILHFVQNDRERRVQNDMRRAQNDI